jgi:hypothetical protein
MNGFGSEKLESQVFPQEEIPWEDNHVSSTWDAWQDYLHH